MSGKVSPEWEPYVRAAKEGRIPFVPVTGARVPGERYIPKPQKIVDPLHPYAHYRTRFTGGMFRPRCAWIECRLRLRRNDLLCCSPACEAKLLEVVDFIKRTLTERPTQVYADTLFGGFSTYERWAYRRIKYLGEPASVPGGGGATGAGGEVPQRPSGPYPGAVYRRYARGGKTARGVQGGTAVGGAATR